MENLENPVVPAVNRALNILEFVAKAREPVSIKQVAQSLELPNTTAFRIVKQLSIRGYLEESESQPGCYHLGLQLLTLSNGMTYINNLRQVCHAELDHLAIESHQAVQMGILKGNHVTYIEQILPPNPVLIYTTPYAELPLNISAAGKVLAAFSSQSTLWANSSATWIECVKWAMQRTTRNSHLASAVWRHRCSIMSCAV